MPSYFFVKMTGALVVLAVNNGWLMPDMVSDPIFCMALTKNGTLMP